MQALIALTYAALCMAGQARHLARPPGNWSPSSSARSCRTAATSAAIPGALIELLLDLLPLRQAFAARNIAPAAALLNAIDRMMPMLRFFRHGDGNFALFNGMGPTQPDLIATMLAYDDARGAPVSNAPHSGYQRIEAGEMRAADGHRPAAADRASARRRTPAACRSSCRTACNASW